MPETELTGSIFMLPSEAVAVTYATSPSPEARLVERVLSGDDEAFAELYRKFAPMVHGIALSRVGHPEADDVVQEVFISVHKSLNTLRDRGAVGPWLARIARNQAENIRRSTRPSAELNEEITRCGDGQEAREILSAIRSMPDAYRETLVLRLIEGMTGPEIAAATGMSHESVRVNLHRGMKLLRTKLGLEVKK
jgi:RNA polymerase sigma-70 factor (ECF subfamily)